MLSHDESDWIERQMLDYLPTHAANSIDRQIILDGIALGFLPSHVDVRPHHPVDVDVRYLRFRAACARAEAIMIPAMSRYLLHRAHAADAEATAMDASFSPQTASNSRIGP